MYLRKMNRSQRGASLRLGCNSGQRKCLSFTKSWVRAIAVEKGRNLERQAKGEKIIIKIHLVNQKSQFDKVTSACMGHTPDVNE